MNDHPLIRRESRARTYPRHLPLVPVRAEGLRVMNNDGRWLIDCLAGAGSMVLGHNHPVVTQAIRTSLDSGAPLLSLDLPGPLRDAFFDELHYALPEGMREDCTIHLCAPSGANAVEAALLLAEAATGGWEHVAAEGGFHGCTRGARAVSTGGDLRRLGGATGPRTWFLPYPQDYRCPFDVGGPEGTELAIAAMRRLFIDPHSPMRHPASAIVECVLGEGGSISAPSQWLQSLRTLTREVGVPLIADEIQSGMGRTGRMWSFEHSEVVPDMVLISKGLGGGVPIAVVAMRSEWNEWEAGAFTGTFRGHSLAFAAATAVLSFMREQDLPAQAEQRGRQLLGLLRQVQAHHPCVGEVRGAGLLIGVEFVETEASPSARGVKPPAPELARRVQRACFDNGLIVEVGGAFDNVVRLLPPLVIESADIERIAEMLENAIATCTQQVHAEVQAG